MGGSRSVRYVQYLRSPRTYGSYRSGSGTLLINFRYLHAFPHEIDADFYPNPAFSKEQFGRQFTSGIDDSRLVAGADGEDLQHPTRRPQQLLVVVASHDAH
jgi:hypothetical protein